MSASKGIVLASNVNTGSATAGVYWSGGRAALILIASSFGSTCKLQCQGPDGSTWIDINATTYSANQVTAYDLPAGQYRMNLAGTISGLYASLVLVPNS